MITGIDHLVVLVTDLEGAMDDYGRLGFTVERGGEHPGGTHNALIAFADGAYLELIAFREPDRPHDHPWHAALAEGEGLVAFALGSSDLAADAAAIRARGLAVAAPLDGGRRRPDGVEVAWRNAGVGGGPRGRQRPFLIEDVTPRARRVASGPLARHGNSVVSVVDVTLTVADLDRAGADFAALLDLPLSAVRQTEAGRSRRFATPRGAIVLTQPAAPDALLTARGDYLSGATLGVMRQGGEPTWDEARAHGAIFTFRPV